MKRSILLAAMLCTVLQMPAMAEENNAGKDYKVRVDYVTGTSNYTLDHSGRSGYTKNSQMFEVVKGNQLFPYLNIGVAAAYLKYQSEMHSDENMGNYYAPAYPNWVKFAWDISTKVDALLVLVRPNVNFDIAQVINVGVETGFGAGYFMKNEKWKWKASFDPAVNYDQGSAYEYSYDPYMDLGVEVSWIVDDHSNLGVNFGYFMIDSEFGHYVGGEYYRFGLFYKVRY